jgi:hypothetical protein
MEIFSQVSWWGIIVGWLVSYFLGALWFSPKMFLKPWVEGMGPAKVKWPLSMLMFVQIVTSFVFALALGLAMQYSLVLAIIIALAATGMIKSFALYSGKTMGATATETAYVIAQSAIIIVSVIVLS